MKKHTNNTYQTSCKNVILMTCFCTLYDSIAESIKRIVRITDQLDLALPIDDNSQINHRLTCSRFDKIYVSRISYTCFRLSR